MRTLALSFAAVILAPAIALAQPTPTPDDPQTANTSNEPSGQPPLLQPDPQQPRSLPAVGSPGSAGASPHQSGSLQPSPVPAGQSGDRKDPVVAAGISALVTGGGFGLLAYAGSRNAYNPDGTTNKSGFVLMGIGAAVFLVGPTTGHIYAGRMWSVSLGVRLASLAAIGIGITPCIRETCAESSGNGNPLKPLLLAGLLGLAIGTVMEIATAPRAARDYNHKHGLDVQVAIVAVRDLRDATSPGFGLVGRF